MSPDPENNPYLPPASDPLAPRVADSGTLAGKPDLRIKDPRNWGWAAITFIWIHCVTFTLQWFVPPHPVWAAIVTLSIGVSVVAAIVSYFVWLVRVVTNAKIILPGSGPSAGWAIGCHFIPFVNWVVPAMNMKEVADATFRQRPVRTMGYVVVVWWGAFILRGLFHAFLPASPVIAALNWVAGIGAAWLIIRISLKQLDWREAGLPEAPRPMMVPGGGPRPVAATRVSQPGSQESPGLGTVNRPRGPSRPGTPAEVRVVPEPEEP